MARFRKRRRRKFLDSSAGKKRNRCCGRVVRAVLGCKKDGLPRGDRRRGCVDPGGGHGSHTRRIDRPTYGRNRCVCHRRKELLALPRVKHFLARCNFQGRVWPLGVVETKLYVNGIPLCLNCDNKSASPPLAGPPVAEPKPPPPPKKVQSIDCSTVKGSTIHIVGAPRH